MSRIGKKPIEIPAGVTVELNDLTITVSGPKGKLVREVNRNVFVSIEGNIVNVTRKSEDKNIKALHGLYRSLISNMIVGVSQGFTKKLNVKGVGFRLTKAGNKLTLNIGFSHPCEMTIPEGMDVDLEGNTAIIVKGICKEKVGSFAADIKALRPVEPYHHYGIHYDGEKLIKKQGKTGKR
ncbi:MAG: 50S ribosomal protein L6 [Firmicutes bacterium]|nr:50S ribosomal protein L6 [Bacillota bacterium]MCL2770814.1 50S ribosomal protein L6 [Bacillota bacterium]